MQGRFVERGKEKAQAATAAIVAGIIAFGFSYPCFVFVFHLFFGWPASLWYALTLPPASLLAHYYVSRLGHLRQALRNLFVQSRAPALSRRLLQRRAELISEIEAVRADLRRERAGATPARPSSV